MATAKKGTTRAGARSKRATPRKPTATATAKPTRRWSARVTVESDALELEPEVFKRSSARAIALSLKRSADRSTKRKSDPYRSAMSMLTFYINRAGSHLPAERKRTLNAAKVELRKAYGKET